MICRICGEDDWRAVLSVPDSRYGRSERRFDVVRCRGCRVMVTCDGNDVVDPSAYYPSEYGAFQAATRPSVCAKASPVPVSATHLPVLSYVAYDRMSWLGRVGCEPGRRVLEVGCGAGRIMHQLQQKLGWNVTGIEVNADAAAAARARGLEVHTGTLEDFQTDEQFELVLFIHVLEHLVDPIGALRRGRALLRPGGKVVIAVPNADSLERRLFGVYWDGWDIPRHVHHFSPPALEGALRRAGFDPEWRAFEWYSLFSRSLANRLFTQIPYNQRKTRLQSRAINRLWGLILAALQSSSAIQVIASRSVASRIQSVA